ncbi:MAG: hypothetical protein PHD70_09145 [Anaerostipes sp.]|nr:hypothetical protein [Anaerostipes sp.]
MRPRRKGKRREEPWVIYSRGEDIFYMILHIVSAVLAAGILTIAVVFTALDYSWQSVLSAAVYGSAMLIVHILLSIYHGLPYGIGKDVMYIVARNILYIFFVGTAMAVNFISREPLTGENQDIVCLLFGVIGIFVVTGIVFTSISMERFHILVLICYFMTIWLMIVPSIMGIRSLNHTGMFLLIGGNIGYTVCGVCRLKGDEYAFPRIMKKISFYAGTALHFACVMVCILLP